MKNPPNKFMDAERLEEWVIELYPDIFDEWELSDPFNGIEPMCEFWDWLALNRPGIMAKFMDEAK